MPLAVVGNNRKSWRARCAGSESPCLRFPVNHRPLPYRWEQSFSRFGKLAVARYLKKRSLFHDNPQNDRGHKDQQEYQGGNVVKEV